MAGLRGIITLGAAGAPAFGADGPDRIRKALEAISARAFLASSENDTFDGANNVRNWSRGLTHVATRLVPGAGHAMAIYYDVRDEILSFVKATALKD